MSGMKAGDHIDLLLKEMKSEHDRLIQTVGKLRDALRAGDMDLAKHHLLQLQIFQQSHFEHEDTLMDQYEYPHAADHKSRHNALSETLHKINRLIHVEDMPRLSAALADYLETSLAHIIEVDRPFQKYLSEAGAQES